MAKTSTFRFTKVVLAPRRSFQSDLLSQFVRPFVHILRARLRGVPRSCGSTRKHTSTSAVRPSHWSLHRSVHLRIPSSSAQPPPFILLASPHQSERDAHDDATVDFEHRALNCLRLDPRDRVIHHRPTALPPPSVHA